MIQNIHRKVAKGANKIGIGNRSTCVILSETERSEEFLVSKSRMFRKINKISLKRFISRISFRMTYLLER